MKTFADRPLTSKLMTIILSTAMGALCLTTLITVVSEGLAIRQSYTEQIATLSEVVGANSIAALTFSDPQLASDVLTSLTAEPGIVAAHLLDREGEFLAYYRDPKAVAPDDEIAFDPSLLERSRGLNEAMHLIQGFDYIDMVRPVRFDGDTIGYVQVRANLDRLVSRLINIAPNALGVILFVVLIAYFCFRTSSVRNFDTHTLSCRPDASRYGQTGLRAAREEDK